MGIVGGECLMTYSKTNWDENTEITSARLNNMEAQHEKAIVDARVESAEALKVEIVSSLPDAGTAGRVVFNTADNRFYFDTGTAWHVAAVNEIGEENFTPTTTDQSISEGYHNGNGTVYGVNTVVTDTYSSSYDYVSIPTSRDRTPSLSKPGVIMAYCATWMRNDEDGYVTIKIDGTVVVDEEPISYWRQGDSERPRYGYKQCSAGNRTIEWEWTGTENTSVSLSWGHFVVELS